MTKPSYDAQTPFRRERPKLETQATERLYKDAPPGILMFFCIEITTVNISNKSLKLLDCCLFKGIRNDYIKEVIITHFIFSLNRLKA